jgi:RimJ/RimL family protein N-acetyltransferase
VINRIIATAHPHNHASQRVMAKEGLAFYKKGLRYGGNPRNWYELKLGI